MFKSIMSKSAWIVTLMVACVYIFSSIGAILTNLMDSSTIAYVAISVIFAMSVAYVFIDILARLDKVHKETERH